MPQISSAITVVYRIGDPHGAYPIFDATGSTINPGRWNTASCSMIYTSRYYSTSVLEKLVHGSGMMPPNQHYITVTIPHGVTYEVFATGLPANRGWDDVHPTVSKIYGDDWRTSLRSLLLFVPSVVARIDENILINPDHPEFSLIYSRGNITHHQPVVWDSRLFGTPP